MSFFTKTSKVIGPNVAVQKIARVVKMNSAIDCREDKGGHGQEIKIGKRVLL